MSAFARLSPRLQEAIVARLGWTSLRPVQEQAAAAILDGANALILAPTAGGKTEAALFPILSRLMDSPTGGVGALYVAPIKALLNNQAERLGLYTEMVGLRRFVWHGDTLNAERRRFVREPAELLMTTPESLEVMLVSRRVDAAALFSELEVIVVDEIHALAGTDRGAHLLSIVERLAQLARRDVQRIGLSATVGNPADILAWLRGTSGRAATIVDPPRQPSRRQLLVTHRPSLAELAREAARMARGAKTLFFCQTRSTAEAVAEHMRGGGTTVFVHHSAVSREERQLAEESFHKGSDACIVCTSTLELGIDVGDLDRVLQAEAPGSVGSFLQRMGRTGRRAGQVANTSFFCETAEGVLQAIALIELARVGWVEDIATDRRCWPVLIHQLLAMSLADDGVTLEGAWQQLQRVPDFRGIRRGEYERLVAWMLRDRSLQLLDGHLLLGPEAERRYGRRNFAELYSVFSSPQTYAVETRHGQALGSLQQGFVDRLVEGVSCFLLSGRAWAVLAIHHPERRIVVESAPRGRQPTWGGMVPQFLGAALCGKIREVVAASDVPPYLTAEAAEVLRTERAAKAEFAAPGRANIEVDGDELRWWTFAGGRINHTLRHALAAIHGDWKIVPDNFLLKIRGEGVTRRELEVAFARLAEPEFWEDERLWRDIAESLPAYRLSKFQSLMPPWVERECLAAYLLDIGGAWRWLTGREPERALGLAVEAASTQAPVLPSERARWVADDGEFVAMCERLRGEAVLGFDLRASVGTQTLCLLQIAAADTTYLIDPLALSELAPLALVLNDPASLKVTHASGVNKAVLARHGLLLRGCVDVLVAEEQSPETDWLQRPLTAAQTAQAVGTVEDLLKQHARRCGGEPGGARLDAPSHSEPSVAPPPRALAAGAERVVAARERMHGLYELLSLLFDEEEFRLWLQLLPDGEELARGLPPQSATQMQFMFKTIGLLSRHGRIDDEFFEQLRKDRWRHGAAIDHVRSLWIR